jgi:alpha-2-macroglobulin
MKRSKLALGVTSLVVLAVLVATSFSEPPNAPRLRQSARQEMQNGNWNDAYVELRKLVLHPESDPKATAEDIGLAVQCLNQLGRTPEIDEFLESAAKVHKDHWQVLQSVAQQYLQVPKHGFIIAGKFERGHHRGGGRVAHATERDRVRALQLYTEAVPLAEKDDHKPEVARFFLNFAETFLNNRGIHEAWRLQVLSDLTQLPDYDEGWPQWQQYNGAPVDAEGNPVFYTTPDRWEAAENDGQRWRWCQAQAVENDPAQRHDVLWQFANFNEQMFGVQSMQHGGHTPFFGRPVSDDDTKKNESGTYALHTLGDDETIAKLANGVKRFKLPDEFNFLKIYKQLADDARVGANLRESAVDQLARLYENRRQYPEAADWWKKAIATFGPGPNSWRQHQREQIVTNWGQFEATQPQPAREGARLEFRYRNGKKVKFTAHAMKEEQLLKDVKDYLKSDPGQLDWQKVNLSQIGWRIVHQGEVKYLGEEVAKWDLDLEPRENHFDRRITIDTPLKKAGAYMLTAEMEGGNVSKILVWVADTAIAQKMLDGKVMYYVADAVDGTPVTGANVEFFGYRQEHLGGNRWRVHTTNFAEKTNPDGITIPDPRDLKNDHQWLITARNGDGRMAYFGFTGVWTGRYYDQEYNAVRVFAMTDRPVYRPDQKVNFKLWVRRAQYDREDDSEFAKQSFPVEIFNPKGEKIYSQVLEADEYGGLVGEHPLPKDATLGMYNVVINQQFNNVFISGGNTFRVEEYKKPEFEVSIDAPKEPIMLGEKFNAKIEAKYYFGSPVTNAKVNYKITRVSHTQDWYPHMPWDWCYGPGYWWFAYDYPWYPGWSEWVGCIRPMPIWWWRGPADPPEVVADVEVEVGPDGTVDVEIDTTLAKELHANQDHEYTITAEVRDQSRRVIVGTGKVLVARKPFKIFSWVDRGYYRVGDVVKASFKGQTLDNRPVQGQGELKLLKISYKDGEPIETPVQDWKVDTNEEGYAEQRLKASEKGQYRLSYTLTDSKGHEIEGGYIFTIIGDGFSGEDYRFENVELIPEKREYAPGETVKLQVNVDRPDATVLLFVRPTNGIYLPPKVIRVKGKSAIEEIMVVKKDMPNFFVEALTLADGKVYVDAKEIVVPPEKRILNVEVLPSETAYKPGQKATVKVRLTDHAGENFVGSTVMTVYDKAVEYISGGSNVPDIKEFFWKWRRHHQPQTMHSLAQYSPNMTLPHHRGMAAIGLFGHTVADEMDALAGDKGVAQGKPGAKALRGESRALARGGAVTESDAFGDASGGAPGAPQAAFAAAAPADAAFADGDRAFGGEAEEMAAEGGTGAPNVEPTVRTKFADTAKWVAALTTGKDGTAEVEFDMPENLSAWKIRVWGMGHGTRVGSGEAEVVTRKNLIVRLQAPRFFVQKDEVVLSANVHNYLETEKVVTVVLDVPADKLKVQSPAEVKIRVPAGGEQRVDWRCSVLDEGETLVRMKALTDEESDATEVTLPSYVHGMLKTESWAGTVRPEKHGAKITINVPKERRVDQSVLEIRYSPSLAGAMVDALPYLADYSVDSTDATLNRFLPTVITQKTLLDMKLNLAAIRDKRANLNAQEIGDDRERAKGWKRFDRNPVFDEEELGRMVKEGVQSLTDMQNSDGGWGWFSGEWERSWPHTTAQVVRGLQVAQQNDVALVPGVLENGIEWLKRYQQEQVENIRRATGPNSKPNADNLDSLVYMVLVESGVDNEEMRDFLYRDRNKLDVYAKATFGLALQKLGQEEKLAMIMRNIEQFVVEDEENETAYLKLPNEGYWWYWYGSETEANAYYLKLLARTEAGEKRAPRLVKYLLNNRKHATYWSNTRDTALVVEAFGEYLRASGEMKPEMVVEVWIDGEKRQEAEITAENLFTYDNKFVLTGADVKDGSHDVEIRRQGKGPVYFNAYLTNFTLEDQITKAGLEVKVQRKFYKLNPVDKKINVQGTRSQAVGQKVEKYEREELKNLDTLKSGDLVEVELEIESKNDYEYIMFEDMKAAGFEPVELRSGYSRDGVGAYVEYRDNRVSFFMRQLARGKHSVSYRLRAEIPGKFSALPATAAAVYAPELRGNSDELKLKIED